MPQGQNTKVSVGEVLLDSSIRKSFKITRIIGNSRVEIQYLDYMQDSKIVDVGPITKGLASGVIKHVSSS